MPDALSVGKGRNDSAPEDAMIKSILVCLEGSASSKAATRTAIEIARESSAAVVGLAIIDEPGIRAGTPTGAWGSSYRHDRDLRLLGSARFHAADWIDQFERCRQAAQLPGHALEIIGRPAESIIGEMGLHDLTVMGRDANFRFLTESEDSATREKILRHASHPVLLIPESDPDQSATLGKTVLVAYDGSASSKRALNSFAQSGLAGSREVHVVTVGEDGEKAWDVAMKAVERLRSFGIDALTENIVSPLPTSEALIQFGRELGASLVVMGAFAHSRLAEMLHGSGTRAILEKSAAAICLQH
jgi:nucleotide-binding universal stress UspA family protein